MAKNLNSFLTCIDGLCCEAIHHPALLISASARMSAVRKSVAEVYSKIVLKGFGSSFAKMTKYIAVRSTRVKSAGDISNHL